MTAKPSVLPYIPSPKPVDTTPKVNVTRGPSYNDAFAQFINKKSQPVEKEPVKVKLVTGSPPVSQVKYTTPVAAQVKYPTPVAAQVKQVQVAPQMKQVQVAPQMRQVQAALPTKQAQSSPQETSNDAYSVVQQRQEDWTNTVLQQVQQKKLPASTNIQRVKTERIQPYVSNQDNGMSVQQNTQGGQSVYYTIQNTQIGYQPPNNQQQQNFNINGQGYQQSY